MIPASTVDNSNRWKVWHSFNYFTGGGTFLVGSIILFPFFTPYMDTTTVSAWLYTIGSFTFLLADFTQWLHYVYSDCRFLLLSINFFVNVTGSFLYLVGSACFIPALNAADLGMDLFIIGSGAIVIAQLWKLFNVACQKNKSIIQGVMQDYSGFILDSFAGIGGGCYLVGTIIFKQTITYPDLMNIAAGLYSIGGFTFFLSGTFMHKRYFWQPRSKLNTLQNTAVMTDR